MLTWKVADGSQALGNALEYEVTYKRDWESWEVRAEEPGCPGLGCTLLGGCEPVVNLVQMSTLSVVRHYEEMPQRLFQVRRKGLSFCLQVTCPVKYPFVLN